MNLLDMPRRRLPKPVLWMARIAFWLMLAAVAAASLLPESLMPDIGAGHVAHFMADLAFALAAALGYGWMLGYGVLLALAVALAGLFELAQLLLSGRTGSWADFAFGSIGALAGVTLAHLIRRRIGRDESATSSKRELT